MRNILELKIQSLMYFVSVIIVAFLCLLINWTPSGESWGYWFFNKELIENGKFIINDRSPLFTLYLTLFSWLNYPTNIIFQHFFSSAALLLSFIYLLKKFTWTPIIIVASAAFVPFILISEPPTQALALAIANYAVGYRINKGKNINYGLFYFLLFCSFLTRGTYVILLSSFVVYDIYRLSKKDLRFELFTKNYKSNVILLLTIITILLLTFIRQSSHPFNNAYFISTDWMPTNGKSMTNASFIQAYHERYIIKNHGECCLPEHHMFYKEAGPFKSATNILTAFKENPKFVSQELIIKSQEYTAMLARLLNYQLVWISDKAGVAYKIAKLAGLFLVIILIYFALAFSRGHPALLILVFATILSSGLTIFFNFPKPRYLVSWVPIFLFAYFSLINLIHSRFVKFTIFKIKEFGNIFKLLLMLIILKFACSPINYWTEIKMNIVNFIDSGQISILETTANNSNLDKITSIKSVINQCNKVLATTDAMFIGSFTDIDLQSVSDYWIFPPSSREKIDFTNYLDLKFNCIFVSDESENSTDYQYTNFVKPLEQDIINRGGFRQKLTSYGYVTVLPNIGILE